MKKPIGWMCLVMVVAVAGQGCATHQHLVTAKGVDWKGAADDPETNTRWNASPTYLKENDGTLRATGLKSFEGIEEPTMKWVVAGNAAEKDDFINITDEGNGVVRMFLRYRGDWWDGDQGTTRSDRQRAEVKGIGPHQRNGETFEYGTTFRTDPAFKAYGRFCHVMQVKATDGDKAPPLVTLSLTGDGKGALQYYSGKDGFKTAATFAWTPGEWQTVRFRLRTSVQSDGELLLSVNDGPFEGVSNIQMYRPDATGYRPKWGLYRGTVVGMTDDWVEHKDQIVHRLAKQEMSR